MRPGASSAASQGIVIMTGEETVHLRRELYYYYYSSYVRRILVPAPS